MMPIQRFMLALIVLLALLPGFSSAAAQAESHQIAISEITFSAFPVVEARFRVTDAAGQFVSGLTDFTLTENGQPVSEVSVRLDDAQPVTVVFVLDLGRYSGTTAASDNLLRQALRAWADGGYLRDGVDSASIVVNGGGGYQTPTTFVLPPTQSLADFRAAVDALNLSPGQQAQSLAAVEQTLTQIAETGADIANPVYVIYISRIVDGMVNSEAVNLAQGIGAQARELDVPVYVLHTDTDGNYAGPFQALAVASGGRVIAYNNRQDTGALLTGLYGELAASGKSYIASYRSALGDAEPRTVTIGLNNSTAQAASSTYQVNVSAPAAVMTAPVTDFAIQRTASEETAASDAPEFDVDSAAVRFDVTWGDGLSRRITQAELLVNGIAVGKYSDLTPVITEQVPPVVDAAEAPTAVTESYELLWDLSAQVNEGSSTQRLEVRITDDLGLSALSPAITGSLTVDYPATIPVVNLVNPANNSTIERIATLDSAGAISGYALDAIPLLAQLVWPGGTPGDIVAAEILVDGEVVANFPYPTVLHLEPDTRASFSGQPAQAESIMELQWDVRALTAAGPNLRDVQIQVRNAHGATASSAPITLNVQVVVPPLQLPQVMVISPAVNATIERVALPRAGESLEFQDSGTQTVIAGIIWPDQTPRTLVVAELLLNGLPLGTESYPSLLTGDQVGAQAARANPNMRFFRVNWDISSIRTAGPNLGQLQVRVRDEAGFEAVSAAVPVNVQVQVVSPPTVTMLTPNNNSIITRAGQINPDSATPIFDTGEVTIEAAVEWPSQLPFVLSGVDLLANGAVVATLPPAGIDTARQSAAELPNGSRRMMLRMAWDIDDIQTAGANLYQLQLRARDESGLTATSAPVNLNVQVAVPDALPPLVNITAPTSSATIQPEDNTLAVTAEVLWPDNQARSLQFVELSVDGVARQTLVYPQGTRFTLNWDAPIPGSHQLAVRVRDLVGLEAVSAPMSVVLDAPVVVADQASVDSGVAQVTETASAVSMTPAACPDNLLAGWDNIDCLRGRAVMYLPWLAVAAMGVFVVMRLRATRMGGITRTIVGVGRKRRPIARLTLLQGPAARVGQDINVYANLTTIGRDPRLTDIQIYSVDDESSISTQHCTIRHVRGRFTLMDDNSTNGTQVNGLYVSEPVLLNDGDEITLGIPDRMGAVLRFHTRVVDMKEQETKLDSPAPAPAPAVKATNGNGHSGNGSSEQPSANAPAAPPPVRSTRATRARSVDMMDNILSEISEKTDKPFRPNITPADKDADK